MHFGALIGLAAFAMGLAGQAPPVAPKPGSQLANDLGNAVHALQASVVALDPAQLHLSARDRAAVATGDDSIQRNLSAAAPGLLAAFRDDPSDLGAAFRLYRDLSAVESVAQRSAASAAGLAPSSEALQDALRRLGDWIEQQGSAQHAALQRAATAKAAAAAPAPQPKTLVIDNANSGKKALAKPTIPH